MIRLQPSHLHGLGPDTAIEVECECDCGGEEEDYSDYYSNCTTWLRTTVQAVRDDTEGWRLCESCRPQPEDRDTGPENTQRPECRCGCEMCRRWRMRGEAPGLSVGAEAAATDAEGDQAHPQAGTTEPEGATLNRDPHVPTPVPPDAPIRWTCMFQLQSSHLRNLGPDTVMEVECECGGVEDEGGYSNCTTWVRTTVQTVRDNTEGWRYCASCRPRPEGPNTRRVPCRCTCEVCELWKVRDGMPGPLSGAGAATTTEPEGFTGQLLPIPIPVPTGPPAQAQDTSTWPVIEL